MGAIGRDDCRGIARIVEVSEPAVGGRLGYVFKPLVREQIHA